MLFCFLTIFLISTHYSKALEGECDVKDCSAINGDLLFSDYEAKINDPCFIFLSHSSIPSGGMGIFTLKKFSKGETILFSDGPNIPIIDPYQSSYNWRLFESYWWGQHSSLSPEMRFEANNVADYQITFGALPNFHTFLSNLGFIYPERTYDDHMHLNTSNSPGSGAYSYHTGRTFYAARDIEAGEELFLNYGETYLDARSWLDHVPRNKDFLMAGAILSDIAHSKKWVDSRDSQIDFSAVQKSVSYLSERVASLLPNSTKEFLDIYDSARKMMSESFSFNQSLNFAIARHKSVTHRSLMDIQRNGFCLDNIVPKPSTIPFAGNGAFAQRFIAQSSIVVPIPLLHMTKAGNLAYTKLFYDKNGSLVQDGSRHKQLLLNYCFGHRQSTLLMCPTTNAVLINHKSTPNAIIRWADWDEATVRWKRLSLKEIERENGRGLSLEVVALRDIEVGEEIFIDYGEDWDNAWKEHSYRWNNMLENKPNNNDAKSMFTGCLYSEDHDLVEENYRFSWQNSDDEDTIQRLGTNGSHFSIHSNLYHNSWTYWPCTVLEIDSVSNECVVRIFQHFHFPKTRWEENNIPRILRNYPISSIKNVHKPYHSDIHSSSAFRHFIAVPDEIFPVMWKNRCTQSVLSTSNHSFSMEEKVLANWQGKWYPGFIARLCDDGSYEVAYEDGDFESYVSKNMIRKRSTIEHGRHPFF